MAALFDRVKSFFERDICKRAAQPLKEGVVFLVQVDGQPFSVRKSEGHLVTSAGAPAKPEMSFFLPLMEFQTLEETETQDIGEIGVQVIKLMTLEDFQMRMTAKVHITPLDLFLRGYLGVIPLGGPTVMKYLASKGVGSLNKIKDTISKMRS